MKRTYTKDWCQGFCTQCGTSCADYCEDLAALQAELSHRWTHDEAKLVLEEIDELKAKLNAECERNWNAEAALNAQAKEDAQLAAMCNEVVKLREALEKSIGGLVWFLEGPYGPSPSHEDLEFARKALKK